MNDDLIKRAPVTLQGESARRRISPDLERYEHEKLLWIACHPEATPREYQQAMVAIARRCGV